MKPMAIVTILAAAVQVVNALTEARAGTAAPGGYSLVGVTIGLVAAVLLAVSGAALLRRGQDAATISVVSATASAALVIAILFVQPWMSIFGILLGIAVPTLLVVVLLVQRGSQRTA